MQQESIISKEQINYLNKMVKYLESEQLSIFAGAGISVGSGFVDWKGLMKPIIEQLGINPNIDLALAAQFYVNEYNRHDINELIFNEFNKAPKSNEIIKKLGKLPIKSYWTTNYDSLIEDTLRDAPIYKTVNVVKERNRFKYNTPSSDVSVYKMHGDKESPDAAIITKNDYETYDITRDVFTKALFTELITNTFLFIGFSFSDPNLERILSVVKHTFDNDKPRNHYCFMKRVNRSDYKKSEGDQFSQDYNYQKLRIREMRRYGIQTILINDFSQILVCLDYIKTKLDQKRVFISGTLNNNIKSDSKESVFIQYLSQKLVEKNYKIVTGFGKNIGNYLYIGACSNKNINEAKNLHKSIEAYPLVTAEGDADRLREELISDCGCIITLFGKTTYNKLDLKSITSPKDYDEFINNNEFLKKDGVVQEFKFADRNNKTLIPIGATGKTSKFLWQYANKKYNNLYEHENIRKSWEILKNTNLAKKEDIVNAVIKIIEHQNITNEQELVKKLLSKSKPKKIFLSFHYTSSHKFATKIRKIINNTKLYTATEEETVDDQFDSNKIMKWIDSKINNTVATMLLYDNSIFSSQYVEYEISKSIERGNKIFVITQNNKNIAEIKENIKNKFKLDESKYDLINFDSIHNQNDMESILNQHLN